MSGMKLKDLEKNEKPREKIKTSGVESLTDIELLAVVLRTGGTNKSVLDLARSIVVKFGGITGVAGAKIEKLINIGGVGPAKACSLLASFELSKRLLHPALEKTLKIRSPKDAFDLVSKDLCFDLSEKLILISINSRGKFISKDIVTAGTLNETIINAREIFQKALSRNASSIILAHNHPSGDASPSTEDIEATNTIAETGKLIGIPLLDHLVVTNNSYMSLKQLGVLNGKGKGGDNNEQV